jgi:2-polyprenyl-6-methoxyphenol hydroxylase-like FAD-dependent oxidoreductase
MLAKSGIPVTLLDAGSAPDTNPRAAHYAPSAVYDFTRAGVIDDVNAQGIRPDAICWRKSSGELIARIPRATTVKYPMIVLPLDRLLKVFDRHLEKWGVKVLWNHKVVGITSGTQKDDLAATIVVETPEGEKRFSADYIIGADGANSGVRRALFGKEYPGETLPQQIIASNVYFDFKKHFGFQDTNFIVHPTNWYMAARITDDGLWRCTYGDIAGLTKEEYVKRQPMRYEEILPRKPNPDDYKLVGLSPYKLQQRCAPSFHVGRFLLVADAAHLCNPL